MAISPRPNARDLAMRAVAALALLGFLAAGQEADAQGRARLSRDLVQRIEAGDFTETRVIATGTDRQIDGLAARHGLRIRQRLTTGAVLDVPAGGLAAVAADATLDQLSSDYVVQSHMGVTNETIGADLVQVGGWAAGVGPLTGRGVGVAVIDSGVAPVGELKTRVVAHVDFTEGQGRGRDEHGHGTHVAGIIAATGANRFDDTRGVAPGAHIIDLKVLDEHGSGSAGNVVAAIDWAIANRQQYNIKVINLSIGGPVLQGWRDDPLCQAVERAYQAGITVVASAGNYGKTDDGRAIYGGITTPGISPFAITVGALNTKGTPWRGDDEVASYSSKGPTMYDHLVKPDVVAPGNRILGLAAPGSTLVQEHPELVVSMKHGQRLLLSGTSMAAAVVSGSAAVLIERHDHLSPFATRALLQYTSEPLGQGLLVSGTGALDLLVATSMPNLDTSQAIRGQSQTAARLVTATPAHFAALAIDNILWGNALSDNILWGNALGDNILWGNALGDNILWGNALGDNILWGNALGDNILWGNALGDNILWGNGVVIGD